jgi:dTDP-4-dehydro-6-deoxy-alpha-D-glucopyranose 2,3-dehydratase
VTRQGSARQDAFRVVPIAPSASEEWYYGPDSIRHRSGRFFSVVGLAFRPPGGPSVSDSCRQPVIDQPETGILGFVVRQGPHGSRVLVQEKFEPGNVRGCQLAPTCQATASNLERVHGGEAPPGAEFFTTPAAGARILADSLQSEQGTRFFRKRNRNVTLELRDDVEAPAPSSTRLRWMDGRLLLGSLARNHRVNTDARSVLVCTPWRTWVGARPFSGRRRGSRPWLSEAYDAPSGREMADGVAAHLRWLGDVRKRFAGVPPRVVGLGELPGFRVDGVGLSGPPEASWDVRHFSVRIPSRERGAWDQPLVVSRGPGMSVLCAFRRGRDLRLLFRAAWEPGLHDGVELHATYGVEPGGPANAGVPSPFESVARRDRALVEVWQSEEGGRFFRERVLHRIVLIDDPGSRLPGGHRDVGLREAEALAAHGVFTNEARSTLSLILSLA